MKKHAPTPKPQGHRLRRGRVSSENQVYLLTTVTDARQPFFQALPLGRIVVRAIRFQHENGYVKSLAFTVMPDHLHWLVQLGANANLSSMMCIVKSQSAKEINLALGRQGTLWQPGFHDHALRKEEDIKPIARYIIMNPVRAGLVQRVGDYPLWDAIWL